MEENEVSKPVLIIKLEPLNALCRICFCDSALHQLFHPNFSHGTTEMYPKMIRSCFNIEIIPEAVNMIENYLICNNCIQRLHDAYSLKLQIENTSKVFYHTKQPESAKIADKVGCIVKIEPIDSDEQITIKRSKKRRNVGLKAKTKRLKKYTSRKNPAEVELNLKLEQYQLNKDNTKCNICNETFPTHRLLMKHMNLHFPKFICDICGKYFAKKYLLKRHVNRHNELVNHTCLICNKSFKCPDHFKRHMKNHDNPTPTYRCPKCMELFKTYYSRVKHLVDVHNEEPERYRCKQCPRYFLTSSHLSGHIRKVHNLERNHVCTECGFAFFEKSSLVKHIMLKHNKIRNFHCDICQKAYSRKCKLKDHMRSHSVIECPTDGLHDIMN